MDCVFFYKNLSSRHHPVPVPVDPANVYIRQFLFSCSSFVFLPWPCFSDCTAASAISIKFLIRLQRQTTLKGDVRSGSLFQRESSCHALPVHFCLFRSRLSFPDLLSLRLVLGCCLGLTPWIVHLIPVILPIAPSLGAISDYTPILFFSLSYSGWTSWWQSSALFLTMLLLCQLHHHLLCRKG